MAAYTTIDDPEAYFQCKLYTGTGSSNALTFDGDTDMQPDFVWIKSRSRTDKHTAWDSVRGVGRCLFPSENNADEDQGTGVTAFGSDGFTVGAMNDVNYTDATFAAWCWKESATSGMAITAYTGNGSSDRTVSHGLSAAPELVMVKNKASAENWQIYWNDGTERNGFLNINNAFVTPATTSIWGTNVPTSSVFYVGDDSSTNSNTVAYISYAFKSKQGFSKFGSYTGNGQTDGPYVFTGFRPAFCLIKRADSAASWVLIDNKRSTSSNGNPVDKYFNNNTTDTETTGTTYTKFDFCANGIKVTEDNTDINASGGTYIYIAFAEAPLVNSEGVPGNAR